jgi:glucose dehydrogenase/catechol 2,3-dioxygenase-like lactoylglutathione lyase family enzyme
VALAAVMMLPPARPDEAVTGPGDWARYARDLAGTRYSPLQQIDTGNVAQLQAAWSFRLRPEGGGGILSSTTPIMIDNVLYLPVGNAVVALEADSGSELWRHPVTEGLARRAVSWWPGDESHAPRIFFSNGSHLFALDAKTGRIDSGFGAQGAVELGVPYFSPPTVYRNVLAVGANVNEMPRGAPGHSRAFDARTGEKLWSFHTVPQPGEVGHETWLDEGWKERSGTNVWIWYMTVDEETGTLYMPVGGPSPNYYGGDRPGDNLFGNSVVAVDAGTGELKWYFQTIHHDLWDSDLPAPPVLVDIEVDGRPVPALAATGKSAFMYILDRHTGVPVFGVEERPVAAADVPGEWYSPTQPFPLKPERLTRSAWSPDDVVSPGDTNAAHAAACQALLREYGGTFYNAGPFTPFFFHEEGGPVRASINIPINGGSNWGGSAADPATGYVFVNSSEAASIGFMERRRPGEDYGRGTQGSTQPFDRASLSGSGAYSTFSASFEDETGQTFRLPCIRPPWGRLFAVNAHTGEIAWQTRLGVSDELPAGRQNTGRNNTFGGPIATAGGLVFIGATDDHRFRAFDSGTGEELWSVELEYHAQAVPITYLGEDGRQYVAVVAAGGAGKPEADGKPANRQALLTFALPLAGQRPEALTSLRPLITQASMNVYRRFVPERIAEMVTFYDQVLGLQPLQPIDLGGGQQMILFGIGSGQIKLAAGLKEGRQYHPGAVNDGTGIRLFTLFFPDQSALRQRLEARGIAVPEFTDQGNGARAALVRDPGGFTLQLVVLPEAPPEAYGKVEVGINVSDLEESRAFYRDFIGLDELPPVRDTLLGVTKYPYRHGETTINLWSVGEDLPADTGSAGIQYVVSDAVAVDALASENRVTVETPLGELPGFDLRFVWLNDPDGVTNYFAQVGVRRK